MIKELTRGGPTIEEKRLKALENQLLDSYEVQAALFERTLQLEEQNLLALEVAANIFEMLTGGGAVE